MIADNALISALVLYGLWVLATYFLEGRLRTFLRPEAKRLRIMYVVIANLFIGILVSGWVLHELIDADFMEAGRAGFGGIGRTVLAVGIGAILGIAIYLAQGSPSRHPVVFLNGFAQVWPVSTAEVVICWGVVGAVAETQLRDQDTSRISAGIVAALIASILFGVYHIAHSPPFNSLEMIVKLIPIGLGTSLFFFVSHNIYGTVVFHNFFAIFGVLQALKRTGKLGQYEVPAIRLIVTALISLSLLIVVHGLLL